MKYKSVETCWYLDATAVFAGDGQELRRHGRELIGLSACPVLSIISRTVTGQLIFTHTGLGSNHALQHFQSSGMALMSSVIPRAP